MRRLAYLSDIRFKISDKNANVVLNVLGNLNLSETTNLLSADDKIAQQDTSPLNIAEISKKYFKGDYSELHWVRNSFILDDIFETLTNNKNEFLIELSCD